MEDIRMPVAGAGATAVGCAILGLKTQAVTTVGDDEMGDFLVAKMEKFGVDCHMVARDGSVQTSATILPVRPNGERPALHVPGTVATFTVPPDKLDAALDARIVHVGGTGLLKSFDGEPSVALLRRAKELQRTTTFDFIQATPETFAFVKPTLPYVDYFVPSIEEASEMAGRADPQKVAQFYKDLGARNVLLTMGGNGVYVSRESDEAFQLRAHAIKVVDTTGRGDSFTAGIIVGLVHDRTLKSGARFASTVAAKVAMGLNSDGKLKSFEDTVAAMKSWPLRRAA
jgi:sugar/nucleoside kinase (ribokinase family)